MHKRLFVLCIGTYINIECFYFNIWKFKNQKIIFLSWPVFVFKITLVEILSFNFAKIFDGVTKFFKKVKFKS